MKRSQVLKYAIAALLTLPLAAPVHAVEEPSAKPSDAKTVSPAAKADHIQLAILLDTSGSMEGLINQARTQIWKIVNELATAKRSGQTPDLRVALYEYGNDGISEKDGYVRKLVDLTDDLDKISEELFALTTNGGQEYCGHVIAAAMKDLDWSKSNDDLKLIFIAGNEPFSQGPTDFKKSCQAAIKAGITVNTIFCGPEEEGVRTGWQEGAQLADGSFLHIDQNQQVATIATPYDEKLAELSSRVNTTYVVLGDAKSRRESLSRQAAQDKQAETAAPAAAAERAGFKGSGQYRVSGRDLVEGVQSGKLKLEQVKDEELPEELKKLDLDERRAYVEKKAKERSAIQAEINELAAKRKQHIAEQEKLNAANSPKDTLDAAVIATIRKQAGRKQFKFEEK